MIGSGLAAAQQLNRAGHWVTVFETENVLLRGNRAGAAGIVK